MRLRQIVFVALVLAAIAGYFFYQFGMNRRQPWSAAAITATYAGVQLKEMNPATAMLILSYDLQNNTDTDFQLANGPDVATMSRLKSNGSLSSEQDIHLGYPTFLPARQRARVTLQISRNFTWPAVGDAALQRKLKAFVNQGLGDVDEFVLFDQANRNRIDFPRGWQKFDLAAANRSTPSF